MRPPSTKARTDLASAAHRVRFKSDANVQRTLAYQVETHLGDSMACSFDTSSIRELTVLQATGRQLTRRDTVFINSIRVGTSCEK
jgi:hypothetical protein